MLLSHGFNPRHICGTTAIANLDTDDNGIATHECLGDNVYLPLLARARVREGSRFFNGPSGAEVFVNGSNEPLKHVRASWHFSSA